MKKFLLSAFLLGMIVSVFGQTVNLTKNPYGEVNWSTYNQYKANYHTHTTNSDGSQTPSTVINEYGSKGYDILSITDHNVTTWTWPHNNYNMLAIKGNEYSSSHHMNAFLNFSNSSSNLENGIPHVQSQGGISLINHPGRYRNPSEWSWYIPWFRDYSTCVALEVFNQGDRYSSDRQLWDNINENLFPATGKLAWGMSNDDKHSTSHLYHNFQFMLMPSKTEAAWEECMTKGAFYFCKEPGESGNANVPRISNIVVDNNAKTITITATGYNSIKWIGPGTVQVGTGNVFDYSAYTDKPFVRAVLDGSNGDSYTQPFGFETVSGPSNDPPSCAVTTPSDGAHYDNPQSITISASASDSDGSVSSVEFFVNGSSIGTDNTSPYSRSYSIPANGAYAITVKATDNDGAATTSSAINITVGVVAETTSARINSSMDDVEERGDGSMYTNSSDIEMVYDGSNQTVGLRFVGLNIPQGATISSANIQFTCDETNSGTTNLTIKGHDADNSAAFSTSSNNVSARATTSASVSWSPAAWNSVGQAGSDQCTPDLSSIIQEIVNRGGYSQSSAISIIITGSGERTAESYDGSSSSAPLLTVEYTVGQTPSNNPPSVAITTPSDGASFDEGTVVSITANASDSDGSVTGVEFFVDGTSIGTDATAPYSMDWTIGVGTYNVEAVATDNEGASTTSSAVNITGNAIAEPLPSPWANNDIGSVAAAGGASYSNGTFTIDASGADIWNSADEFHYVYQSFDGDGEIIARVESLTNTNSWAKAGVMFRESLATGSKHAMTVITPGNGASFQRRTTTDATSLSTTTSGLNAPIWVKIERSGNVFTGSYSANGASWTVINSETISMASSIYVGLSVTSHNDGAICTSVIDNVSISATTNQAPSASITTPSNGASFDEGTVVSITSDASDSDGSVTGVEFFVDGTSIGTDATAPYSMDWTIGVGTYNVEAVATDNEGASTTSSAVIITGTAVSGGGEVVASRISDGMDDVEEAPDGSIYTGSSDIELVYDSYNGGNQVVGLRFTSLNIPQGATINSANIQFTCDETNSGTCNLTIKGHDADNSEAFTTATNNVSSRATTSASVNWSPADWNTVGAAGSAQQTPDIKSIIQEIVNRGGFSTSSAITIIITGSGERTAESYNGSSSQAALLTVDYSTGTTPTAPVAEKGVVTNAGSSWMTVSLTGTYTSPVVVATPVLASSSDPGMVTRVKNVTGNSFDLKVQNPSGTALSGITVHYIVVEEGTYTLAADGAKMEAKTVTSTQTAENNNWTMEARSYNQSYTSPVVLGQVMSENDADWSVFWACSNTRSNIPTASELNAGKNVGEDPDNTRANETIGLIILEAGTGSIGEIDFEAGVGSDIVRGPDNSTTGYSYTHSMSNADAAILSAAAIDGGNGGWPVLFGGSAVTTSDITMIYDEDQVNDSERKHTTEQVAYMVMENATGSKSAALEVFEEELPQEMVNSKLTVHMYPNPVEANSIFKLSVSDNIENMSVSVFNMSGKLCAKQNVTNSLMEISTANFKPGVYIVHVNNGITMETLKLLVK